MKNFVISIFFLLASTPAFAQAAPCDLTYPTSGTVIAGQPMTVAACIPDNIIVTGWAIYDKVGTAAAVRLPVTMIADTVTSAVNGRSYSTTITAPSTVGSVHTYTIVAMNSAAATTANPLGEGPASNPFVSTVLAAPVVPPAPTKLRIQ